MGIVWRLETDQGLFAVKQLLQPLDEAGVATEVAFQSEMVHRGVPAATPLRTPAGRALADLDGLLVRVSTWLDLEEPRTDLDPAAVGALLGLLHREPVPAPGAVDPWYTEPVAPAEWRELAASLGAAGAPFAAEFESFGRHQLRVQEFFARPRDLQLCHRDLWADNLRAAAGHGLCVIDWDLCGPADPGQELGVLLTEFCYAAPARAAALYAAYLDAGGTGRLTGRGDFTMAQAQFGHFATTAARRWLTAADDDARADAEAWFRLGLEKPLDVDHVDELLAATAG
jgi:Ser/Thr protein kinase RdoA (MazF antagonist)